MVSHPTPWSVKSFGVNSWFSSVWPSTNEPSWTVKGELLARLLSAFQVAAMWYSPAGTLNDQLAGIFSYPDAPIWMDSSTGDQCASLCQQFDVGASAVKPNEVDILRLWPFELATKDDCVIGSNIDMSDRKFVK